MTKAAIPEEKPRKAPRSLVAETAARLLQEGGLYATPVGRRVFVRDTPNGPSFVILYGLTRAVVNNPEFVAKVKELREHP